MAPIRLLAHQQLQSPLHTHLPTLCPCACICLHVCTAIWYYLYLMLPKEALTLPFSALEAAVSTANVLSAPLAAGLLLLESTGGFKGWQWLFVCEGIATLLIGLTTAFVSASLLPTARPVALALPPCSMLR